MTYLHLETLRVRRLAAALRHIDFKVSVTAVFKDSLQAELLILVRDHFFLINTNMYE
jgi:hypothetical protein